MRRRKLTPRQIFYLLATLVIGLYLAQGPRLLVNAARQDVWLSLAAASAVELFLALVLHWLACRFPGRTIFQYSRAILGPYLGAAAGLLLAGFFAHTAALALRQVSDFFLMIMPETPLTVFVATMAALTTYGAYGGWPVIGRTAEILGVAVLAIAGAAVVISLSVIDAKNLLPILPYGPGRALAAAPLPAAWLGACVLMGIFAAYLERPQQTFLLKARGVFMGIVLTTLLELESVAALGQRFAGRKTYPVLFMLRLLRFGQFLERTEVMFYLFGTTATLLIVVALQHAAAQGISEALGGFDYRPLVVPLGLLITALASGLVDTRLEYDHFMLDAFPPYALSLEAGLPLLLVLVALLRRRRPPAGSNAKPGA